MNPERPTRDDLRADFRRLHPWPERLVGIGFMVIWVLAVIRLGDSDVTGAARIAWIVAPLVLLVPALLRWRSVERRKDELQRDLDRRAAHVAMQFAAILFLVLLLLDAAIGLPLRIPGPFGLPDDEIGWRDGILLVMFAYAFAWIREHRRVVPKE